MQWILVEELVCGAKQGLPSLNHRLDNWIEVCVAGRIKCKDLQHNRMKYESGGRRVSDEIGQKPSAQVPVAQGNRVVKPLRIARLGSLRVGMGARPREQLEAALDD